MNMVYDDYASAGEGLVEALVNTKDRTEQDKILVDVDDLTKRWGCE